MRSVTYIRRVGFDAAKCWQSRTGRKVTDCKGQKGKYSKYSGRLVEANFASKVTAHPAYFPATILSQTCQKAFISSGWPRETRA